MHLIVKASEAVRYRNPLPRFRRDRPTRLDIILGLVTLEPDEDGKL